MRLPSEDVDDLEDHQNLLRFDDGGMRGLAAGLCWCGLVYHVRNMKESDFACQQIVDLAKSLLSIPTVYKTQGASVTSDMIRRIIKQNVDSKKLAVSSYEWSQILSSMQKDGASLSLSDAMTMYNENPEVLAHGGSSAKEGTINHSQCLKDLLITHNLLSSISF